MAAPLFTNSEIERLLVMPKRVDQDEFEGKWSSRVGTEGAVKLALFPEDPDEKCQFQLERIDHPIREEVSITLIAKLDRVLVTRFADTTFRCARTEILVGSENPDISKLASHISTCIIPRR